MIQLNDKLNNFQVDNFSEFHRNKHIFKTLSQCSIQRDFVSRIYDVESLKVVSLVDLNVKTEENFDADKSLNENNLNILNNNKRDVRCHSADFIKKIKGNNLFLIILY